MAMLDLGQRLYIPAVMVATPGTGLALSAANDKVALIFRAPDTRTITKLGAGFLSVPTGATLDLSLQTVDGSTGNPNGIVAAGANGSITTVSSSSNVWHEATLITPYQIVRGNYYAIVITAPATSFGSAVVHNNGLAWNNSYLPYASRFSGSTWTKTMINPSLALRDVNGYIEIDAAHVNIDASTLSFNSNSNPNEYGNMFSLPFRCRVVAMWQSMFLNGGVNGKLYDANNNVLASTGGISSTIQGAAGTPFRQSHPLDTFVTLNPNTTYRVGLVPASAANVNVARFKYGNTAAKSASPPGSRWYQTARLNSGGWADTDTMALACGLVVDQLDVNLFSPLGMDGGIN